MGGGRGNNPLLLGRKESNQLFITHKCHSYHGYQLPGVHCIPWLPICISSYYCYRSCVWEVILLPVYYMALDMATRLVLYVVPVVTMVPNIVSDSCNCYQSDV